MKIIPTVSFIATGSQWRSQGGASGANAPDLVDSAPGPELLFAPGPELFLAPGQKAIQDPGPGQSLQDPGHLPRLPPPGTATEATPVYEKSDFATVQFLQSIRNIQTKIDSYIIVFYSKDYISIAKYSG